MPRPGVSVLNKYLYNLSHIVIVIVKICKKKVATAIFCLNGSLYDSKDKKLLGCRLFFNSTGSR